ncbi:LA_2272 family surface repeat-containing protein [Candidatus Omnitrophota bacterium]
MKRMVCIIMLATLTISFPAFSQAQSNVKPIQLSLWDTIQLYDADTSIAGLRLSIYGVNRNVSGIDWGIVPKVTGDMLGWQSGVVSIVEGNMTGYQEGCVNYVKGNVLGWQNALINICKSEMVGFQSGFVNLSGNVRGIQLGFVNTTDQMYGLQVGIVNLNYQGNPFKFLPIVNFSF